MRDSRSSLAVDGDHVGGEGEEVVAGLADDGGVPRALGGEGGQFNRNNLGFSFGSKNGSNFCLEIP